MKRFCLGLYFGAWWSAAAIGAFGGAPIGNPVEDLATRVERAMVKLYGAGQVAGLEGYQTGFFIERDPPVVLTVDSTALEGGRVPLVDSEGERYEGRVVGRDAATGLALLECPADVAPPATLPLEDAPPPRIASPVWVISNAFGIAAGDEPLSLQRGRIVAVAPLDLSGGAGESRSRVGVPAEGTPVLVLSAVTSNPGAAGGAVVSSDGDLVGVVGAECRSPLSGAWLNYALPAAETIAAIERLKSGDADNADESFENAGARGVATRLGLSFLPAVTARTPAFVETVRPASAAADAGVEVDDLVVAIDGATVGEVRAAQAALARAARRGGRAEIVVLRGDRLVTLEVEVESP